MMRLLLPSFGVIIRLRGKVKASTRKHAMRQEKSLKLIKTTNKKVRLVSGPAQLTTDEPGRETVT